MKSSSYAYALELATLEAASELQRAPLKTIQIQTAIKWGGRAIAAQTMRRTQDAHEYAHEALEHAALAGDSDLLTLLSAVFRARGIFE